MNENDNSDSLSGISIVTKLKISQIETLVYFPYTPMNFNPFIPKT